jgi:hypothetical protein
MVGLCESLKKYFKKKRSPIIITDMPRDTRAVVIGMLGVNSN